MLKKLFVSTVYVKVFANRIWLRKIENGREIDMAAIEPFTSRRFWWAISRLPKCSFARC